MSSTSSKGFYTVLAILTILAGGLIFLAYGWYPYILRTSRLHLQAVVDDLCSYYVRFLPLNPSSGDLEQLLILPRYALQMQAVNEEIQTPATLASMLRLVNLGEVQFQISVVEPNPGDTLQTTDRQTNLLGNFRVGFTLQTAEELNSVEFVALVDPGQQQLLETPPGLDRLFHDGNTLICTGQITLNQGLFTFLLPWIQVPQVISAVAGVTRVPHNNNGFNGGILLLLENTPPVNANRRQILARNSFAASLALLISRSGVFRDRFRVAVVDPGTVNQQQIQAQVVKEVGQSGLAGVYRGGDCNDVAEVFGDPQVIIQRYLDQILGLEFFATGSGLSPVNCQTPQNANLGYSIMTLGFPNNLVTLNAQVLGDLTENLDNPIVVYVGFNFPNLDFLNKLLTNTDSPVHVVLFPDQIVSEQDLVDLSLDVNNINNIPPDELGRGFGFFQRNNQPFFSFQSRRLNRLRFTLTVFDACSAFDFGGNQPLPVDVELNFGNLQNTVNQANCRHNPGQVFLNPDNANNNYRQLLMWTNQQNRRSAFLNLLDTNVQQNNPQLDPLFENWPDGQPLFFPYAYRFYATRLFLREEFGWMY